MFAMCQMVAHGKETMFDVCPSSSARYPPPPPKKKSLTCALFSSRQRFIVCNTRQTLPSDCPPSVSHGPSLFFYHVSSLSHGKTSLCVHNLAVGKDKIHRARVCRVYFAMSNTRQSLCRVLFRFCRVRQPHESGSGTSLTRSFTRGIHSFLQQASQNRLVLFS